MDCDCRGQSLPTQSEAWPILSSMFLGLQTRSPRKQAFWIRHQGISSSTITYGWSMVGSIHCLAIFLPTDSLETGLGSHEGFALQGLDLPMALSWLSTDLVYEERELLDYCENGTKTSYSLTKLILVVICTAPSTLATFEPDKHEIVSLLVRLALSNSSPSSMAVLQSALALSSFHRHGLQAGVFRFRARALRTLITSCTPSIKVLTIVQHIAASMILCHLEVCLSWSLQICALMSTKFLPTSDAWDAEYCVSVVL